MAKDKSTSSSSKDKSSKKEKRDKSHSKQTSDGISKSSKREKQSSSSITPEQADKLLQELQDKDAPVSAADTTMTDAHTHNSTPASAAARPPQGALVPFANPLADEKTAKKVFKSVKKANKAKSLKRGVKEVVKTLRKSALATPSSMSSSSTPTGIVVIAADISPMDVISHLPVLCEDHGVPYVYVSSRAELGAAGQTKRPTSVVLVAREQGRVKSKGKAEEGKEDGEKDKDKEEWSETFAELVKVVRRAGKDVRI